MTDPTTTPPGSPWKPLTLVNEGRTLAAHPAHDPYWTERMKTVRDGKNEPEIMFAMKHLLNENSIFIDGGANIGVWSGFAGAIIDKPNQVIAVEPGQALDQLKQNQKLNDDSFKIVERAIWNKSGESVTFNLLPNPIHSTLHLRDGQTPKDKKTVSTITVDDIANEAFANTPAASNIVIKLDVQDAELEALAGAAETLKHRNALVIYEDARTSPKSETTASVLAQGLHVYYVDSSWKVRAIHSADELKDIKKPPRNGYNFLACMPGTEMDKKMQGFCKKPPLRDMSNKGNQSLI